MEIIIIDWGDLIESGADEARPMGRRSSRATNPKVGGNKWSRLRGSGDKRVPAQVDQSLAAISSGARPKARL